jgi:hypothetical protein
MGSLFLQTFPLLCLLAAASFLFSSWSVKRTEPPVQGSVRFALVLLRGLTLTLVGFILLRPVLEFSMKHERKSKAVILVDDSRSMQLEEDSGTRAERIRKILKSEEIRGWMHEHDASVKRFSDRLRPVPGSSPDSLTFMGPATDIATAFETLAATDESDRPAEVVLLSDGVNSLGRDPVRAAEALGVPVHTVTVGSASAKPDVQITALLAPRVAYADTEVTVEATVRGEGFGGKTAFVTLSTGGVRLAEQKVNLPPGGLECGVWLAFRPAAPGTRILRVSISGFPNEADRRNNAREQSIRVLRRKKEVLLAAAGPSPDLAFIRRILDADADVRLTVRTFKNASEFYEGPFPDGPGLRGADVFVLLDVPDRLFPETAWRGIAAALVSGNKPCLWFAGASIDPQRIRAAGSRFPAAEIVHSREKMIGTVLTAEGGVHPALRVFENPDENRRFWESLPPVYSSWSGVAVGTGGIVLAEGLEERDEGGAGAAQVPLIVCGGPGSGRSLAVFADGVFRWRFMPGTSGGGEDVLKRFLANGLRWLTVDENGKPVRFVERDFTAQAGGEIPFTVQATDELAGPLSGADVSISFLKPGNEAPLALEESAGGVYRGVFRPSESGDFAATVEAKIEGRPAGRDTVYFHVSPYAAELLETKANPGLMRSLSAATGGTVTSPDSLGLFSGMPAPRTEIVKVPGRIELFGMPWLLIPAGIFLVLEWIIRKRAGMA